MMKAVLAVTALLAVTWVAALAVGALGGLDPLPRPDLSFNAPSAGGDPATEAKASGPDDPATATRSAPRERPLIEVNSSSPTGGVSTQPPRPSAKPKSGRSTATTGGVAPGDVSLASGEDAAGSPADAPGNVALGNDSVAPGG